MLPQERQPLVDIGGQLALARLLMPEAFGVFALAQSLTGFVSCFTDLAGQKYIIRRPGTVDRRALSSVFTLELLLGGVAAGLWMALAGPVLSGLNRPEQIPYAQWLAVWIVLERLMLPRALLDRAMAFGRSNLALLIGTVTGVAAMLVAAACHAGAYTFIIGLLVRSLVSAAGMWIWAPPAARHPAGSAA